jgi:hypothetical protein
MVTELKSGDVCYFLYEYTLTKAIFLKNTGKRIKVYVPPAPFFAGHERYVQPEKVVSGAEVIAVVAEYRKGNIHYRIEKDLYPEIRIPAYTWPHNALLDLNKDGTICRIAGLTKVKWDIDINGNKYIEYY